MKVIFFDVDGVLNYKNSQKKLPDGTYFVEDDKIKLLKELVDATNAELVLSSSWRSGYSPSGDSISQRLSLDDSMPYFMLCAKLHDYGLNLLSEIPRLSATGDRGANIDIWINEWPGEKITDYVIIDDNSNLFKTSNEHLVLTSLDAGLRLEDVEKAKLILRCTDTRKRILVVDDVETNRAVFSAILSPDYIVLEADDGYSAISILEQNSDISAVITDIQMPHMNGIQLIKKIRSHEQFNNIIIIANTQYGDPNQEEEILNLGATDFLYKPSNPRIIKNRLNNILR